LGKLRTYELVKYAHGMARMKILTGEMQTEIDKDLLGKIDKVNNERLLSEIVELCNEIDSSNKLWYRATDRVVKHSESFD
jgi:hypothetical protein